MVVEECSVALSGDRDMIVIRDGLEPRTSVIARYCGHLDDVTVTSSGDSLLVEFDSDASDEGPGFAGQYTFVEPSQPEARPTRLESTLPIIAGE